MKGLEVENGWTEIVQMKYWNSVHCKKTNAFRQEFHQPERKAQDQTISLTEN